VPAGDRRYATQFFSVLHDSVQSRREDGGTRPAKLSAQRRSEWPSLNFPTLVVVRLWIGPGASTVQDLVLPRMRGTASAAYLLIVTFIGLALGPYAVGRLSIALGGLRPALLYALGADALAVVLLASAARHLAHDEAARLRRLQSG
jgi:hypothetical protein